MEIRLNRRSCFYALLAVLCILLAGRYAFQIEIPRMVLTVIVIAMGMIGSLNETLAIAMGCIPMHQAIDFYIAIVMLAGILMLKNIHQIRIGIPVFLVILMIIWELLHCFIFEWSLLMLLTSLAPLVFIAVLLSARLQDIDYAFITRTMAFLSSFVCVLLLLHCIVSADGNLAVAFVNLNRLGTLSKDEILIGGAINPNSIGIVNVLGITCLLQIRSIGQQKKRDVLYIFALLIFGILTLSKTFLACLLIMMILVFAERNNQWKRKLRMLGSAILIGGLLIAVMITVFPEVLTNFIERFQVKDITSGRIEIMESYHNYMINNPFVLFFGVGVADFGGKVVNVYRMSYAVPHNSIQEIIVAWGIPGLLMITLLILMVIVESKKIRGSKPIRVMNYIPLIIILAKSMAGQLLTSGYTILALGLAYLSLCQDFSKNNPER